MLVVVDDDPDVVAVFAIWDLCGPFVFAAILVVSVFIFFILRLSAKGYQPLDVGVFSPLKHAYHLEMDVLHKTKGFQNITEADYTTTLAHFSNNFSNFSVTTAPCV